MGRKKLFNYESDKQMNRWYYLRYLERKVFKNPPKQEESTELPFSEEEKLYAASFKGTYGNFLSLALNGPSNDDELISELANKTIKPGKKSKLHYHWDLGCTANHSEEPNE